MEEPIPQKSTAPIKTGQLMHYVIQLLALAALIYWCYIILEPFTTLIIWGAILAIALYPVQKFFTEKFRNRQILASSVITVLMLAFIILPAIWLLYFTIDEFRTLGAAYQAGDIMIPEPHENIKEWPLVGNQLYQLWFEASTSLETIVQRHPDEVKAVLLKAFELLASSGKGIGLFILSIVLSGFMLAYAKPSGDFVHAVFKKLAGENGESMTEVAEVTIRNIVKGILGVSVLQSLIMGITFVIAGIPLAGVWALINLIFGIIQIGAAPVALGSIIYIWLVADTFPAILFTIWIILVSLIDNVLKPIVFGKDASVPSMVVFVGSIGGFMASGFIGLFTGAIVLSLGYKMFDVWLKRK